MPFSFLFGPTAGRETTESTSSEVSNGYCGDVENLSEHDEIVENCFVEPTVKQQPASDAQCEEEAHTPLLEGIRTNLATRLCGDAHKLPLPSRRTAFYKVPGVTGKQSLSGGNSNYLQIHVLQ